METSQSKEISTFVLFCWFIIRFYWPNIKICNPWHSLNITASFYLELFTIKAKIMLYIETGPIRSQIYINHCDSG